MVVICVESVACDRRENVERMIRRTIVAGIAGKDDLGNNIL
jgi:hypothetical protein